MWMILEFVSIEIVTIPSTCTWDCIDLGLYQSVYNNTATLL